MITEREWAAWTDPETLLDHIAGPGSSRAEYIIATNRQLILWASACCRRIGHLFHHIECLHAVLTAEAFADGGMTYKEMTEIGKRTIAWQIGAPDAAAGYFVRDCVARSIVSIVAGLDSAYDGMMTPFLVPADDATRWAVGAVHCNAGAAMAVREKAAQSSLLRDILGNPFRPFDCRPEWRTTSVVTLANAIYDDRQFDLLPQLATALSEAGCGDEELLNHCRRDGPHARGCWVVDLLLPERYPRF